MDLHDSLIPFLQRLVQAPSVSGAEEPAVAEWASFAESMGLRPVIRDRNVWVDWRQNDGPAILLNSHTDTVKAGPSWTRDPWDGALEDGQVHGLGANDAKGCVVAQLGALLLLRAAGFEGNVVVCASCQEETGGEGMEVIARDILPRYDAALIGEPNNFAVAAGQRGLVKGLLEIPGRRAHASRPWQGENAIHRAARVIQRIEAPHLNVPGDLTRATAQVTLIEGGTQSNVLPDRCVLTVDCRTTPEFDNEAMIAHLSEAAASEGGTFSVRSARFRPVQTATDEPLVQAALAETGTGAPTVFPSVCDLFWVSHVPALVMGPGRPERSHQADEFVRVDEVIEGAARYARLVQGWWTRLHAIQGAA
jgi:acetylornithine deacetylase